MKKENKNFIPDISKNENNQKGYILFFNSPLGLWLLSTVLIGIITFSYQNWTSQIKLNQEKQEKINNLSIEISRRIFIFNKEIEILSECDTMTLEEKDEFNFPKKVERAIKKVNSKECYICEQYKERKLSSLLFELSSLLTGADKKRTQLAFEDMFLIEQFPKKIKSKTSSKDADGYFNRIMEFTKTSLSTEKWTTNL